MMEVLKSYYNVIATGTFIVIILLAHLLSPPEYNWTKNTISDLGAQGYDRKFIMQFGFLAFGLVLSLGILFNGLSLRTAPILIYGICVGATGYFCTKPFFGSLPYSAVHSATHSVFAQIAGISFCIGILIHIFYEADT